MAAVSCYPDLHFLEADCIQQQSEVLRGLANDLHYAANIFNYTAYDIDNQAMAVRRAGWVNTSATFGNESMVADRQIFERKDRAKQLLKDNAMMLEIAEQVKSGLKKLIETVCKASIGADNPEVNDDNNNHKSDVTSIPKADLSTSLEDLLVKDLVQAERVFVDSSKFVTGNFQSVSTPNLGQGQIDNQHEELHYTRKARIIGEPAMSKCQEATMVLQDVIKSGPCRGRGKQRGSKNKKKVCDIMIPTRSAVKAKEDNSRSHDLSPRLSKMEEMEKELLAWIPSKMCFSPLPVDENLKELIGYEAKKAEGGYAI